MLLRDAEDGVGHRRRDDDARLRLAEQQGARRELAPRAEVDRRAALRAPRSMMQHSASATASPPSLQSCAERDDAAADRSRASASINARSASRSQAGGAPATTP